MYIVSIFLLLFPYYSYGTQSCESYTNQVNIYTQQFRLKNMGLSIHTRELSEARNDFNRAQAKERESKRIFINYKGKGLHNWIQDREALAEAHCKLIKAQAQAEILPEELKWLQEQLRIAKAGKDKYCQQSRHQPKPPFHQLPVRPGDRKNPPQFRPLPAHSTDRSRYQLRQLKETLPGKTVPVTQ